jgi:hypothetical protein
MIACRRLIPLNFMEMFSVGLDMEKCEIATMSTEPKPEERMRRMREMFAKDLTILAEDYEHFTGVSPQDAPTPRSKARRKSAALSEPRAQGRN